MSPNPTVHPVRLAALLALLAMFGPFAIDAFFPAFNAVAATLGASPWQMQQTISVYLVAYAVMSLFHGPLSDAYGRRRVILAGVVTFRRRPSAARRRSRSRRCSPTVRCRAFRPAPA